MAKDRQKLVHMHSSVLDKQPTAGSLLVGELAVNNSEGNEFVSLKNSNDKVVRLSADHTMIDWMEKKEVFPYSGVVNVTSLENNASSLDIVFNQDVASNTPHADDVNDALSVGDGIGFSIDMSDYLLDGGNANFKVINVTHQSNLSGITNIVEGEEGSELNVNVENVSVTADSLTTDLSQFSLDSSTADATVDNATYSGSTLDARVSDFSVSGDNVTLKNDSTLMFSGDTLEVHENTTNLEGSDLTIKESNAVYVSGKTVDVVGSTSLNESAPSVTISGATTKIYGTDELDLNGAAVNVSGTTNIKGATNITGNTLVDGTLEAKSGLTVDANGFNVTGNSTIDGTLTTKNATVDGLTAKSGLTVNNGGANISGDTNINGNLSAKNASADTLTAKSGLTVNNGGFNVTGNSTIDGTLTTKNATADTLTAKSGLTVNNGGANISGNTNISGNVVVDGTIKAKSGLTVDKGGLVVSGGGATISGATTISGNTNVGGDLTVGGSLILTNGLATPLTWSYGDVHNEPSGSGSYNAASSSDTAFTVPKSVTHLAEWSNNQLNISGSISATSAIYSSDINLKENIDDINEEEIDKVKKISLKSFTFKDDETKRKMYGVIAQNVEAFGLGELVHMADDGTKGVDYTSLFILKFAEMTEEINALKKEIEELKKK